MQGRGSRILLANHFRACKASGDAQTAPVPVMPLVAGKGQGMSPARQPQERREPSSLQQLKRRALFVLS